MALSLKNNGGGHRRVVFSGLSPVTATLLMPARRRTLRSYE
jgi:hypothetical protein